MLKLGLLYLIALELIQLLTVVIVCLIFFFMKYVFHVTDQAWQRSLIHMNFKRLFIGMMLVEVVSLLVIIPFCTWWFHIWEFPNQDIFSYAAIILSLLLFVGKVYAVQKYLKSRENNNKHNQMDGQTIYK